jgi:hypothetical protein
MTSSNDAVQVIFTVLICLEFLLMAVHDWLNIPGWTHGRQVYAVVGPVKMWVGTLVNSLLPGLAAYFAIRYWHQPKPRFVLIYWVVYCGIAALGALTSWWIPYFRGTDEKTEDMYARMYAGTLQVLPPRGNNPRPNVLHLCFHLLFLVTLVLSVLLWLRIA